jgi:hypothetical protein
LIIFNNLFITIIWYYRHILQFVNSSSSKSFEQYAIHTNIKMDIFLAQRRYFSWPQSLSWIYFQHSNHLNFTCHPIYFASTRPFDLCRNRQTFQNFSLNLCIMGATFSQKYTTLLKKRAHSKNMKKKMISASNIQL